MDSYQIEWEVFDRVVLDDAVVEVTAIITGDGAEYEAGEFIYSIPIDDSGVHGRGGWAIFDATADYCFDDENFDKAALKIVAGGQDVADAVEDGTWEIAEWAEDCGFEIEWETDVR
ncbi:hypothetical protein CPHO_09665 [Corynebacterium phocae]|uniref:Uncharacterized protein n=1 Tax=Corynebacterium phocae TaxID=161895 RepID=A0A1L7D4Z3_9CORY|nr:hypothetical protein [Corynebacterium phocae]APT93111.1 hypothetical protein CPHO_09665 [Corynebacterium phocae]KAA8722185.1 hypothetical protein F4V58_09140 [Corynebacterium phocae]